eukprot:GFUD01000522.1.p1 GENE.GFUD01000522.1~~GFUD01000522.1.p1  ORF type:complete len:516 (+),score=102.02 GFUD01000522.1:95-1642(+)
MVVVDPDLSFRLAEAVQLQAKEEPDLYLVGREGSKIPAHRSVLGLFSPLLRSAIQESPQHLTSCILIPDCSYASLVSVVGIFYTGVIPAAPEDGEALEEIKNTCELLGFHLKLGTVGLTRDATGTVIVREDLNQEVEDNTVTKTNLNEVQKDIVFKDDKPILRNCDLCGYSSELPINLMKHYSVDHFEMNISQLTNFYFELNFLTGNYDPCKVCNKVLGKNTLEKNTHKEVIEHIGVYHMKVLDILKSKKIDLPNLLNRSKIPSGVQSRTKPSPLKNEEFNCDICQVNTFSTRTEFQDHLSGVHFWTELVGEYGNKYSKSCSLCRFKFQTLQQLAKHIGTIHNKVLGLYERKLDSTKPDQSMTKEKENLPEPTKLFCTFSCPDVLIDRQQLEKHYMVSHFGDQLVSKYGSYESQCTLCFAWLNSKEELAVHIGGFHGKVNEMMGMDKNTSQELSPRLNEDMIRKILPLEGSKSMNEEMLVKKMIEKSKKLMRDRNLQISKNLSGDKKSVNISMKR